METPVIQTLGSVPLVSILRRSNCNGDTWLCPFGVCIRESCTVMQTRL